MFSVTSFHGVLRSRSLSILGPRICRGLVIGTGRRFSSIPPLRNTLTKNPEINSNGLADGRFTPEEREAARLAREAAIEKLKFLPEKWIPFAELSRLEKPIGSVLLLLPSYWGITMAAYSIAAPLTTFLSAISLFTIGAVVMRGAGCTINDLLDRNLDNKVSRTMERPITSGRVTITQAIGWLAAQSFIGLFVLLSLPTECFFLGALSLPFVAVYPLFKRFTYYPQAMIATCFGWGCLLGFPSVGAPLNWMIAGPLFASNWFWSVTYDSVYAHQDKAFDITAGIKSTALAWKDKTKTICYGLSACQVVVHSIAGIMNGMGPGFYTAGALGFYRLFSEIKKVDLDNEKSCWSFFTGNLTTGAIFWSGMLVDYIMQLLGFL